MESQAGRAISKYILTFRREDSETDREINKQTYKQEEDGYIDRYVKIKADG